jgi:PAS domain S-box-containing protein
MMNTPTYEELEQRVKELDTFISLVPDMICKAGTDGYFKQLNPAWEEVLGYAMDELLSTPYIDLIHPDDREKTRAEVKKQFSGIPSINFQNRYRCKDGSYKVLEWKTTPASRETLYCVVRDITAHKKTNDALNEIEERFRISIEHAIDGIALSENGRYFFANASYLKMFGYDRPDELVGKEITITVHPLDRERIISIYNLRLKGKTAPERYEFKGIRRDGTHNHIEITAVKINYKGRSLVSASFRDVTERKKAEKALKENEAKFRTLFDASPNPVALSSLESGKLADVNIKFCELTGFTKKEVFGKTVTELGFYSEKDRKRVLRNLQESGRTDGLEVDYKVKAGKVLNALLSTTIIHISDAPYLLSMFVDVTDLKRLEATLRQSRKMESIGTLAGGIAHDFNNILGIILGNAELAELRIKGQQPVDHNVDQIIEASLRGRQVVRQLLDFSRQTEQTKFTLTITPLIKESLKLLRSLIPANIDIRESYRDETYAALVDPAQIHQVIINLCTNASQAISEKGGVIDVAHDTVVITEQSGEQVDGPEPGRYIRLRISDTGHGISPENLERVFDPYFTSKEKETGTGLGLSVVHGIVKDCNGVINVTSERHRRTTFTILFPVSKSLMENHRSSTGDDLPMGNERVLFIDDEQLLATIGQKMLEKLGYRAHYEKNPVTALELFESGPDQFDLVVTDMAMPKMTGPELALEIFKIKPDMPMILCTGHSENMDEILAEELGFKAFLVKPVKMQMLANAVRKALDKR